MKTMTCKELGGACDEPITGNTPEEMGQNAKNHAMQQVREGEPAHVAAMGKLGKMSKEAVQAFWAEFERKCAEAEEVGADAGGQRAAAGRRVRRELEEGQHLDNGVNQQARGDEKLVSQGWAGRRCVFLVHGGDPPQFAE